MFTYKIYLFYLYKLYLFERFSQMDTHPLYDIQTEEDTEERIAQSSQQQIFRQCDEYQTEVQCDQQQGQRNYDLEKVIFKQRLYPIEKEDLKDIRHSSIGAFTFKNAMKQTCAGSGILISNNIVLTAAHNFYDPRYGKNTSHKFYLAPHGVTGDYQQIEGYRYPLEFQLTNEGKYDYALVKLKENKSLKGYLEMCVPCQKCLKRQEQIISVYGYPVYESNYYCQDKAGVKIKLHQYGLERDDRVVKIQPDQGRLCYSLSTFQGHSGSPVVADNKIIAVHIGSKSCQEYNRGRLITPEMIATLNQWRKQLNADPFSVNQRLCSIHLKEVKKLIINKVPQNQNKVQMKVSSKSFKNNNKLLNSQPKEMTSSKASLKTNQSQPFVQPNQKDTKKTIFQNFSKKPPNGLTIIKPATKTIQSHTQRAKKILKLGKQKVHLQKYEEAYQLFTEHLQIQQKRKGKNSIQYSQALGWLGDLQLKRQDYQKAKQIYKDCVAIYEKLNGIKQRDYAVTLVQLGKIYRKQNKFRTAIQKFTKASKIYQIKEDVNRVNSYVKSCLDQQKKFNSEKKGINSLKSSQAISTKTMK